MGLKDKLLGFVAPVDDDEEEEEEEEYTQPETTPISSYETVRNTKVKQSVNQDTKMVLFEPRTFEEAEEIATHLKQRRAAVVNLHRLQKDQAKRVVDFLSGVIYAIEGDIQRIGPKIFLCTPRNISVAGTIDLDEDEQEQED